MNQLTVNIPYNTENQALISRLIQSQTLADWLGECFLRLITDYQTAPNQIVFANPISTNWGQLSDELKDQYLSLTSQLTPTQPQVYPLTITLNDNMFTLKPDLLADLIELSYDHNKNFWTFNRLANYFIAELINPGDTHFKLPIAENMQHGLSQVQQRFNAVRMQTLLDNMN